MSVIQDMRLDDPDKGREEFCELRRDGVLRSSPGKLQEIPHWKVVPLLAMLLY
jgi:hypothetical protein